ncbi:MAG: hypothetical protein KH250_08925 [Bifidobacterium longum]|nr:hypothetical protein [Bifidobacterium longum]
MSVEESAATPVLVAAVDNDRMALLALKGILPQLLPAAQWMWGAGTSETFVRCDASDPIISIRHRANGPGPAIMDSPFGEAQCRPRCCRSSAQGLLKARRAFSRPIAAK